VALGDSLAVELAVADAPSDPPPPAGERAGMMSRILPEPNVTPPRARELAASPHEPATVNASRRSAARQASRAVPLAIHQLLDRRPDRP